MNHAVRFAQLADDPAGHTCGKAVIGNIFCDNAACTDHAIVADRDTRTNRYIRPEPAVIADFNGLCIAEPLYISVLVEHGLALVGQHRVHRGYDGAVRPEITVVADGNKRIILHGEIEIDECALADGGVLAVMECDGALQKCPLTDSAENFVQNSVALLGFILIQTVVVDIEVVGTQLDGFEFRISGTKKLPCKDFFFFPCHFIFLRFSVNQHLAVRR